MNRLPALAVLLTMTFLLAACGGEFGEAPEPEQGQEEPPTGESGTETTQEESAAPEGEQGGQDEGSGYSVTTLEGEEVSLGEGDEVTALFFMAGW